MSSDSDESHPPPEQEQARQENVDGVVIQGQLDALQAQVVSLRAELASVKSSLRREKAASLKNNSIKVRRPNMMSTPAYARELLAAAIRLISSLKSKGERKKTLGTFFDALNCDIRMRLSLEEFGKKAMQIFFSPFAMLRLMYLNGGKLNYEAIELIRSLETQWKK